MQGKKVTISFSEFQKPDELASADRELIRAAHDVAMNAYAPYSMFRVGAAIRLESGRIVCGANVENAAYPSGICAERNALSNAVSNYPGDKPVAIAIAAFTGEDQTAEPVTPCGTCRQVLAEEEYRNGTPVRMILSGKKKIFIVNDVSSLLPLQFSKDNLRTDLP